MLTVCPAGHIKPDVFSMFLEGENPLLLVFVLHGKLRGDRV